MKLKSYDKKNIYTLYTLKMNKRQRVYLSSKNICSTNYLEVGRICISRALRRLILGSQADKLYVEGHGEKDIKDYL